jgi:hypothetical protein
VPAARDRKRRIQAASQPQTGQDVPPIPAGDGKIRLSFEAFPDGGNYCLSKCQNTEIRRVMACLKKLTGHTWASIYRTGGHGENAQGISFEPHNFDELPAALTASTTRDVKIFSVRASLPCRVYAYQAEGIAFVIAVDRNHKNLRA